MSERQPLLWSLKTFREPSTFALNVLAGNDGAQTVARGGLGLGLGFRCAKSGRIGGSLALLNLLLEIVL